MDDTQACIRMDCRGGNPVSAQEMVATRPLEKLLIVAHTLKWPSGLVCLASCIQKVSDSNLKSKEVIDFEKSVVNQGRQGYWQFR